MEQNFRTILVQPCNMYFSFSTEDDTSIATEVKVPILIDFHRHIYDREWHFLCEFPTVYLLNP